MRLLLVFLGHLCVALGVIGLFLPLLPTTPFLLLAAWCYSRGSERLHRWLLSHPRFARPILDWMEHGVVRPRAKALAVAAILASVSVPLLFRPLAPLVKAAAALTALAVIVFLLTRPSRPRGERPSRSTAG